LILASLSLVLLSSPLVGGVSPVSPNADPLELHQLAVAAAADELESQPIKTEHWAGHQVVFGTREVPVLGTLQTRMDTYTLARVRRSKDSIEIDQRACKVNYADIGGVKVYVDVDALPDSSLVFERVEGTPHYTMTGTVNWGEEDIDDDGEPGMRVYIDAPVCSGNLHVTNKTTTNARAFGDDQGTPIYGEVTLSVRQKILGADTKCLAGMSKDSFERSKGSFRYTKIKANETCKSLLAAGWPGVL
jgi:hypothetical protein